MRGREILSALDKAKDPETTYQQLYSKGQCIPEGGLVKVGPCVTRTFFPHAQDVRSAESMFTRHTGVCS